MNVSRTVCACALALAVTAAPAAGQTAYHSTQDGDWSDPSTWTPAGLPAPLSQDSAEVRHGVEVTASLQGAGQIRVVDDALLDISGGQLYCSGPTFIGTGDEPGHVVQSGGGWFGSPSSQTALRIGGTPDATYTLTGGTVVFASPAAVPPFGQSHVGHAGERGTLVIEGGDATISFRALKFGQSTTVGELVLRPTSAGPSGLSTLQVSGPVNLTSANDVLHLDPLYAAQPGDSWELITASEGFTGTFSTLSSSVDMDLFLDIVEDTLVLTVGTPVQECQPFLDPLVLATGGGPRDVVHSDLNGDGKLDLVVVNLTSDDVSVFLGLGGGTFGPGTSFPVGDGPLDVVTGDLDGNGTPDLAVAANLGNEINVLLGQGDGTFIPVGGYPFEDVLPLALGDMNGDGLLDLVAGSNQLKVLALMSGNGVGGFGPITYHDAGLKPRTVSLADLDDDGDLDAVTSSFFPSDLSVLLGDGAGGLLPPQLHDLGAGSQGQQVLVMDVSGDGILDVAVPTALSSSVSLFLGTGDGGFLAPTLLPVPGPVGEIDGGDLDADGDVDMVVSAYQSSTLWVLTGQGDGLFEVGEALPVAALPEGMQLCDVDGDQKLDLVLAAGGADALQIFPSGSAWAWLHGEKPGSLGAPQLSSLECAHPGAPGELRLSSAASQAAVALVIGLSQADAPLKGGLLVPAPDAVVAWLETDANGDLVLPFTWPADAAGALSVWLQAWVIDAGATQGVSASNGLRADLALSPAPLSPTPPWARR
jgi:hypothetical protein